jgi:large subunit ribosomal protein L21
MYAIVKVGGKQYRVESGDSLVVDRLSAGEGEKLNLEPLLFRPDGDKEAVFEGAGLEKVKVEATVTGHERGKKVHGLKFKPKRGYKRRYGHRADLTRLEIGEIKLLTRKPAAPKAQPKQEPAAKAEPKQRPARKPAAKKPATSKASAKKPAASSGGSRSSSGGSRAKKKEGDDGS